jgi:hypothetical protein
MSSAREWTSRITTGVFFVVLALGAYNVWGDYGEVEALAKSTASCPDCTMTRLERLPWGQTAELTRKDGKVRMVRCRRALVLVGGYSCASP